MSESNKTKIIIAAESTFATTPGEAGQWGTARFLSDSLKHGNDVQNSDEIRNLRDIRDTHWVDKEAGGSINMNHYWDTNFTEELMKWSLNSAGWSNAGGDTSVAAAASMNTTQSTKTFALVSGTFANDPAVGDWVYISGAANAASNGYHKIASVSGSNTFTVETAIGADEAAVSLTVVLLSSITNGNTAQSLAIQRQYTDLTNEDELFLGMYINGWNFSSEGRETMKSNFEFMGYAAQSLGTNYTADAAASTEPAMISPKHMDWIREGTAALGCIGVSFQLSNNYRRQFQQGTFGSSALVQGDFTVSGTLRAYFSTSTLFDKFINQTETSLAFASRDGTTSKGNTYLFDLPRVIFNDGRRVAGGRNQDIIADLSWMAKYDSADACTMKVAKTADT